MISSFENFQSKFVEEALDNINDLEKALLELELSPNNKELLERVFRVMHSLKGGGAMFGFDKLSEFTHQMENIYDLVRSGKLTVSQKLLSVTLKSVDMLRLLLDPKQIGTPHFLDSYQKISATIDEVLREETQTFMAAASFQNFGKNKNKPLDENKGTISTWYIHFFPEKHVMKHGTNLLYLLDELNALGRCIAIPGTRAIPTLDEFHPEQTYIFWDIFLSTDKEHDAILDVFIFVEDESIIEVHKISSNNLFDSERFTQRMDELKTSQGLIELSDITDFVATEVSVHSEAMASAEVVSTPTNQAPSEEKQGRSHTSIRVSSEKIDGLMNLVSELVITQQRLNLISQRYQIPELRMVTESVQKLTGLLRDSTFSISLIPVESLLTRFQRLVRDLSSELGKKISFSVTGAETELDKTMIESVTDPLLHLIRNSIDHGIESPEARRLAGKPETGSIKLEAEYSGANVVIRIKDDGAGIDSKKIRRKAIEKGFIRAGGELSDEEALKLIFMPGFSTSAEITEVSGRGVGMDVVKRNIDAVRGDVAIESVLGKGTTITITLPLVLSIIDGLLVGVGPTQYVLPLSLTDRIYSVESKMLDNTFINVITLGGKQIPFYNMRKEMGIDENRPARCNMVVVNHSGMSIALSVDNVVGKIQAVLKPLGRLYHDQKMVSAATIMGDGTIALVLDVNAIIKECRCAQIADQIEST
jgi:two-component system chemotaxis sensor kinase CheA